MVAGANETIVPVSAAPFDGNNAGFAARSAAELVSPISPNATPTGPTAPRTGKIELNLAFNDRRAPQGRVLTGTLAVTPSPAGDAGKTFDVAIDLPPGLDFVASANKGVTYDPALRAVIMTGLDGSPASQRGRAFTVVVREATALSTLTPRVQVLNRAEGQAFNIKTASLLVPGGGEKARIDSKGGSISVAGGAARLDFGPGALRSPEMIEASLTVFTPPRASAARTVAAATDEEDSRPDDQQPIWSITLSPDLAFETPVTLTTNISGLVPLEVFTARESVLEMRYVYTAWVTRTTDTGEMFSRIEYQTQEMPVTLDEATGEVTARLWHFSTYDLALAQPAAPKPWTPSANAPNVALFRGAATYQQALPALPSFGLEPKLAASYSSASAESNFLQTSEPAMKYQLGRGWSLELPHVAQLVKRDWILGNPPEQGWRAGFETEARGNFTLVMGGMSVGLKPTGANGEYVTDDSQAFRIVRCAKASPCAAADRLPGITHSGADWDSGELEYWQVWTPDGTRYVFGSETSSRATVQDWDYNWCGGPGCGSGWNGKMIGMVWMLRRVYAPDRDLLSTSVDRWGAEYQYTKTIETGSRCAMANWNTPICGTQDDPRIKPARIVYGNSLLGASERYTVTFEYGNDRDMLASVTAFEPGNRPAERTRFAYAFICFYTTCDELTAIASEAYTGTVWAGLPATTFGAAVVSNVYNGTTYGNEARLVTRVANGFGATWDFDYEIDRTVGGAGKRVARKTMAVSLENSAVVEQYEYSNGCYNFVDHPCVDLSRSWNTAYSGNIVGYRSVTRKMLDVAGMALGQETHRFLADFGRLGREYETRSLDGAGQVLSAKQSDIVTVTLSGYPTTTWQVRTTETREYPYGDIGSAPVKRTRTDAFTALGSPKTIQEYGFEAAGDERTTFIGYVKGPVAGEVPVWEALYSGIQTAESETPERLSSTRLYYDNAEAGRANSAWTGYNVYSQTLSRGRLTAVEHGLSASAFDGAGSSAGAGVWAMSTYGYDGLGNLAVLTDAGSNVSSVSYDSSGQFVLESHNALGQVTSYAYYGVNGESLSNALGVVQPYGALKSTTDPNGAVVLYAYDALGRLRKVAQPGDSLADPSEEWRYYDGIETAWTTTATGYSTGPYLSDHLIRGVSGGGWTSATLAVMDRTIYDGLGRAIQTQSRAGQGWAWSSCNAHQPLGSEVIQSTLYDAQGRPTIQTVPYTQTQYEYCTTAGRVNTPYVAVPQTQTVPGANGLAAVYYSGKAFNTPVLTRTDATVNFDWGGSPGGSVPADQFSVRWTGTLRATTSETYTLYATGDDGIRLWVNGNLLIDQWHDQGATEYSAQLAFHAGVYNELRFEFYEGSGGAVAKLEWSSPTISRQTIPTSRLWTSRPVMTPTVPYAQTAYDALGRPITVTPAFAGAGSAPDGSASVTRYGVDANGPGYAGTNLALKAMIDPNGHQKQQVSDGLGRLVRVREFTGTGGSIAVYGETIYTYDAADRLTTVTDTLGNVTTIAYDALGRKVGMVDPDMGAWSYAYNALGQLTSQTDAKGQTMAFFYDALGRMTSKTARDPEPMVLEAEGPLGQALCGTIITSTSATSRVGFCNDALAYGPYLAPRYAGPGQAAVFRLAMTSTQNPGDATIVATIDVFDYTANQTLSLRDLKRGDLGGGITQYREFDLSFDTTGREDHQLEYRVWLKNNETIAHDRTTILWQQPLGQYLYDQGDNGIGRRSRMTDTTGSAWWAYDTRGRVTDDNRRVQPANYTYLTRYGYDDANRITTMWMPGGEVVTNTYDAAGHPFSLTAGGNVIVTGATYNALGAPTRVSFGNGLDKVNRYLGLDYSAGTPWSPWFAYGRLRNTCVITANMPCLDTETNALFNTAYWYDKVGNVTTVRDNILNEKQTPVYDALDRLTSISATAAITTLPATLLISETYAYDKIGNMTAKAGVSITYGSGNGGMLKRLGFEGTNVYSPAEPGASFQVFQTYGAWTFEGSAGVSYNGTYLTGDNPPTPEGAQVAFLQGVARMTTTVTGFTIGQSYRVGFKMAQRTGFGRPQTVVVRAGGTALGAFAAPTGAWEQEWTEAFTATASSLTIAFWTAPGDGYDRMAFIDDFMVKTAGPHAAVGISPPSTMENPGPASIPVGVSTKTLQ